MSRQGITLHIEGRDIFIPAESITSARVVGWNLKTTQPANTAWVPHPHPFRPPLVVAVESKMTGKLEVTLEFDLEGGGIEEIFPAARLSAERPQLPENRPLLAPPDSFRQ